MPNVRKLTLEEVREMENRGKGLRKLTEEQYDEFLREYNEGDYGVAELGSDEKRLTVRNRLKAAAKRRGLSVDFRRTQGPVLRFRIGRSNGSASAAAPKGKAKGRPKKKAS